jgi:hypothetical protein
MAPSDFVGSLPRNFSALFTLDAQCTWLLILFRLVALFGATLRFPASLQTSPHFTSPCR